MVGIASIADRIDKGTAKMKRAIIALLLLAGCSQGIGGWWQQDHTPAPRDSTLGAKHSVYSVPTADDGTEFVRYILASQIQPPAPYNVRGDGYVVKHDSELGFGQQRLVSQSVPSRFGIYMFYQAQRLLR